VSFFERACELQIAKRSFVVATILVTRGHAPQDAGAKALITADGLFYGTVGGGKLEARAIERAKDLLARDAQSAPLHETWNLQRDIKMSCGGEVEILFEVYSSNPWTAVVFGAGHVGQAMVRLLLTLDCQIVCVDSRPEWLAKLPTVPSKLQTFCRNPIESVLPEIDPTAVMIVMTMGHATDFPVLSAILRDFDPPYIGVLGSTVKAQKIRKELSAAGIPSAKIENLRSPMGLVAKTNDPAEIAISIAAEILALKLNA